MAQKDKLTPRMMILRAAPDGWAASSVRAHAIEAALGFRSTPDNTEVFLCGVPGRLENVVA